MKKRKQADRHINSCVEEYLHFQTVQLIDEEIWWHVSEHLNEKIQNSIFGQLYRQIRKQTVKDLK